MSEKTPGMPLEQAIKDKALHDNMARVRHKLFVVSGKGGVGKSSVTVNLAAALAGMGLKTGIVDVDLHGPSVPRLLNITGNVMADESGHMTPVGCGENLLVMSMDSLLQDRDSAIIWRGPVKSGVIRQFLTEVDWGDLDVLLIDSPPGTGDEHLTVMDAIPDAKAVVVTTPQEVSLADVRKAVDFLQRVNATILGLVENMSGLTCPHCGGHIDLFRTGGGEALAKQYGLPFLGAIPLDPAAVVAADRGIPAVRMEEDSAAKTAFLALAETVRKALNL